MEKNKRISKAVVPFIRGKSTGKRMLGQCKCKDRKKLDQIIGCFIGSVEGDGFKEEGIGEASWI